MSRSTGPSDNGTDQTEQETSMDSEATPGESTSIQVRVIQQALTQEFGPYIDFGDPRSGTAHHRSAFHSRALAAKAVALLTECGPEEAAKSLIDGPDDHGIDAVALSPAGQEVWLVQAKWSDHGRALPSEENVLKLLSGLELIVNRAYGRFNARFQQLADRVDEVLASPYGRIHLVLAFTGEERQLATAKELLSSAVERFGLLGDVLDIHTLNLADFHMAARNTITPPITLTVTLSDRWHQAAGAYPAIAGTVAADELARWYQAHGLRLFERNLRGYLGRTAVNQAIVDTLVETPEHFMYFNNGVTVLCDDIRASYFARRIEGHPVQLELSDAQVVNGAQTVVSAFHAFEQNPDSVTQANVMVRVIGLRNAPEGLARRITESTNTQNRMEPRDFIALDPRQSVIRDDFAASLGKSYVYRRGDLMPSPAAGCSVTEAATALACAHPDAGLVAHLRRDHDYLWREAPEGAYTLLFGERPSAQQIWRSVLLTRAVGEALEDLVANASERARALARSGRLLISHIVFQLLDDDIDELDDEWEERLRTVLRRLPGLLTVLLELSTTHFGRSALISVTMSSAQRCRWLAETALRRLKDGTAVPPHPDLSAPAPRRPRRPNSVPLLVDHQRIPDGAQLIYVPIGAEARAVEEWLNDDPSRFLATWVNDRRKPLVWAFDGELHSPTGLVHRIWEAAGWAQAPVAVQGTSRWLLPGEGTLAELAAEIQATAEARTTAEDRAGADADDHDSAD
ncbi:AIPR family protein [Kitasatospora sp. NPDC091257]|uniref:AIPR family protein n=1 Tax=Kitasatospora sp. NPDC091257 TaxID=3364084 RepID=UPI003808D7B9